MADLSVAVEFRKRCRNSDELLKSYFRLVEKNFWDEQEFSSADNQNIFASADFSNENEFRQVIKVEPNVFQSEDEEDYSWKYDEYGDTSYNPSNFEDPNLDEEALKSLTCPYCSKKLNTRRSLKYHVQVKHETHKSGKYECDVS